VYKTHVKFLSTESYPREGNRV